MRDKPLALWLHEPETNQRKTANIAELLRAIFNAKCSAGAVYMAAGFRLRAVATALPHALRAKNFLSKSASTAYPISAFSY
jgi:hypothetical protein